MIVLAVIFPWLYFVLKGKFIPAMISLVLQLTGIGWIPATIWALNTLHQDRLQRKNEMLISEVLNSPSFNIYS
jgi:hypothetical protein